MGTTPLQATPSSFAATPADPDAGFLRVLEYFRTSDAEALNIRKRLTAAQQLAAQDEEGFRAACSDLRDLIVKKCSAAANRNAWIEEIRGHDPEDPAWFAREFVQVRNGWDDLHAQWYGLHAAKDTVARLKEVAAASIAILDALIFTCASQTIPDELTKYLKNYRIGCKLDFVETFHDQLPDEAATRRVLETLAAQSGIVPGIIDLSNGKIIKADPRPERQWASIAIILLAVGFGFALIAGVVLMGKTFHFNGQDWKLDSSQWATLNGAYLLMLVGMAGHWVMDRIKLDRSGADATPLSEWLMWIHVNEMHLLVRIFTVWITLAMGLAFQAFKYASGIEPLTFFTAGYFLDSTYDALIGRFNTFIGTKAPAKTS